MERRLSAVCLLLAAFCLGADKPQATPASAKTGIAWQKNLKEGHRVAEKTGKPMLLVFGAEWCQHCKRLEKQTLHESQLATYINREFVCVRLDLDVKDDSKVAKILEVSALPCTIVLSSDADLLARQEGFLNAAEMHETLEGALAQQAKIRMASQQSLPLQK